MMRKLLTTILMAGLPALSAGCSKDSPSPPPVKGNPYSYSTEPFKDNAKTNTEVAKGALDLVFVDGDGKSVDLKDYRDKKNVVLVVTRGFAGSLCLMCIGQVSRMIKQYDEFAKRDAEILVVFPGPPGHVKEFVASSQREAAGAKIPFRIVLDEDFKTVNQLGIRGDLAKPSTYILDKKGQVRFAYVGSTISDRPSVKAMLQQLDEIAKN